MDDRFPQGEKQTECFKQSYSKTVKGLRTDEITKAPAVRYAVWRQK